MAGILTLESSLNFIFHCPKIIVRKILNFLRCVGKKTALLQAEASACVSGLANVMFCALVVHFIFLFQSLSSKLSAVSLSFYTDGYHQYKGNSFKGVHFFFHFFSICYFVSVCRALGQTHATDKLFYLLAKTQRRKVSLPFFIFNTRLCCHAQFFFRFFYSYLPIH